MFTQTSASAHIRYFIARLVAPSLPVLVCALMVLVLCPHGTAQAQNAGQTAMQKVFVEGVPTPATNVIGVTTAPWRAHFGEHAAKVLRRADPETKREAMCDLIALTMNSNSIDLTATLPQLLSIAEHGTSELSRLVAVEALQEIGTEHSQEPRYRKAMEKLSRIAQEESSNRVRRGANDLLLDFYGDEEEN